MLPLRRLRRSPLSSSTLLLSSTSTLLRRHILPHPPAPPTLPRASAIHTTTTTPSASKQHPAPAPSYSTPHRPAHNAETPPTSPPPADLEAMDVLGNTPVPASAVTACLDDGFAFESGLRVDGGDGVLIVGGEVVRWRPWVAAGAGGKGVGGKRLVNDKGQWEVGREALGVLGVVWPRPDLLLLALGPEMRPLSPETRRAISELGVRVEVLDTRNAAAQYNLLATERGVTDVAAAMVPVGWREGVGAGGR
ncbi:hypothetical protein QBC39DRAFT_433417 [Podospora conica]|nr:hypothetical protein QBC39DRAFT_433417 [Schizothecium conicum]